MGNFTYAVCECVLDSVSASREAIKQIPVPVKSVSFLRGENPTGGCWHGENALVIDFEGDLSLLRTVVFANTAKSVRAPRTLQGEYGEVTI